MSDVFAETTEPNFDIKFSGIEVPLCDDNEYVEWQTWPFDQDQPKLDWAHGICSADDFFLFKPAISAGMMIKVYWRLISPESQ
jgi:hypothetical protein